MQKKESLEEDKLDFSDSPAKKGHHVSQGIVTGIVAPSADQFPNQDNQKEDEKKEEFQILSKDDSKAMMRTKEFETFIDKTSKILERALTGSEDILGPSIFFDDFDGDEQGLKALSDINNSSKDKLNSVFTFQDNVATQRTVTSLQWSPSVSALLRFKRGVGERFADVYLQQVPRVQGRRVRWDDQLVLFESEEAP